MTVERPTRPAPPPAEAPPWFRGAIVDGLQMLLALRLERTPAADAIVATGAVWISALWPSHAWDEALDRPRLAAAFARLACERESWPAPKHLTDALPGRPEPPRLPAPPISAEARAAASARLRALAATIGRRPRRQE